MSKYDSITTAKDLVREVMLNGLITMPEDICRVQDIFGHSTIGELVELANDIGRNDENGNPDPNGSWSSTRRETRSTFYMILTHIWNFDEVSRFWNLHTNPEHQELKDLQSKLRDEMKDHSSTKKALKEQLDKTAEEHERYLKANHDAATKAETINQLEAEIHDLNMKIVELKAKLYDLMTKEEK